MEALDGEKRMLIHGEAMVEIAHHQSINGLQFGKQQCEQTQRVHGPQRVGGMRLQKSLLQVKPELRSAWGSRRQRRQGLFDTVLGRRAQLESVVRHEVEQPQQYLRILQR